MLNSAQSPLKDGFAADFGRKSLFQTQLDRLEGNFEDDDKSEGDLSECEDPIEELLKSIENNDKPERMERVLSEQNVEAPKGPAPEPVSRMARVPSRVTE